MDDMRVGAAFRAVRLRRRWRQQDVADRAGVARSLVSDLERGHFGSVPLARIRAVAATLDIRIDLLTRWRGGELARLLNARHSALNDSVASYLGGLEAWRFAPEVSFSIFGERGSIDILAYHVLSGSCWSSNSRRRSSMSTTSSAHWTGRLDSAPRSPPSGDGERGR
jgi:transcriptional regulator with XRE-family HTH domain